MTMLITFLAVWAIGGLLVASAVKFWDPASPFIDVAILWPYLLILLVFGFWIGLMLGVPMKTIDAGISWRKGRDQ
jgi:hypothetical protein